MTLGLDRYAQSESSVGKCWNVRPDPNHHMVMEAEESMRNEFTAVVERDKRWYIAYCPEIPGANGQGRTKSAALKSLTAAIALILEDRRKDGLRGVPAKAAREKVIVG